MRLQQRRVRITSKVAPWIIIDFMLTQPLSHTRQLYFDKLQRFNEFESFGIDTNSFQIAQTNKHTHMLNGLNAAVGHCIGACNYCCCNKTTFAADTPKSTNWNL